MKTVACSLVSVCFSFVATVALADGVQTTTSPDLEADARYCEVFVDDFALVSTGYRGTGSLDFRASLQTRPGDDVVGAGGFVSFHEQAYQKTFDASGQVVSETQTQREASEPLPGGIQLDGRWSVAFTLEFDNYGREGAKRDVKGFAFYVDIREGSRIKRLWVKAGQRDFGAADFDADQWFYSNSVFLGGYSSAKYLWRDGGSPLFTSRVACAR
jgi:hypothetical protein